jgi:hypothetical protein
MAKKVRTPPPPRKVQAPQRRQTGGAGMNDRRRLLILGGISLLGVVALVAVLGFLLTQRDEVSAKKAAAVLEAVGCRVRTYPDLGRAHTANLDEKIKYNSTPATSGRHYQTPAPWGVYPTPVREIQAVHNLEHGGIVVNYGSKVSQAKIDQLEAFVGDDPRAMLMFPYPSLGNKIALTAWTHLATCTNVDQAAYKDFRDAYRGKGPERFRLDDLQPGQ